MRSEPPHIAEVSTVPTASAAVSAASLSPADDPSVGRTEPGANGGAGVLVDAFGRRVHPMLVAVWLVVPILVFAAMSAYVGLKGLFEPGVVDWLAASDELTPTWRASPGAATVVALWGLYGGAVMLSLGGGAAACAAAALLALLGGRGSQTRRSGLAAARFGGVLMFAGGGLAAAFAVMVGQHLSAGVELLNARIALNEMVDAVIPSAKEQFFFHVRYVGPGLVTMAAGLLVWIGAGRSAARVAYAADGPAGESRRRRAFADWLFENLRTHGEDPDGRRGAYRSLFMHFAVLFLIPWLLSYLGCTMPPYRLPKGEGSPTVAVAQVVTKQVKKKKLIVNPNSAIRFDFPELDDSEIEKIIDQKSQRQYKVDPSARAGALGGGKQGPGGWPEGFGDGKIRFIRIRHRHGTWNDGMRTKGNGDANFLAWFKQNSGANFPVATDGEAYGLRALRGLPKGQFPPFLFITGDRIGGLSSDEMQLLRQYLVEEGGMLFADAATPQFDRDLRNLLRKVLPGKAPRSIANDDSIYDYPFRFPNGAPPMWAHAGNTPWGIRGDGRWMVYCHTGDVADSWKNAQVQGDPDLAEAGFRLGTNVIYHAITHYVRINRKYLQ